MNRDIPAPITLEEIKYLANLIQRQKHFRRWSIFTYFAWYLLDQFLEPKEPPKRKLYNYSNFERLLKLEMPKDHSLQRFWKQ